MSDLLIVGGGIVGLTLAHALVHTGASVTLLEARSRLAEGATGAALGILSYSPSADQPAGWHALAAGSLDAHRRLERRLDHEELWRWPGRLSVVTTSRAERYSRDRLEEDRARGGEGRWLDKEAIHQLEPLLGGAVQGGSLVPDQGWVDGVALSRALAGAAERAGARILRDHPVDALLLEGDRVVGVRLGERTMRARHTLVAAGLASKRLDPVGRLPLSPARGQAVELAVPGAPLIGHLVTGRSVTLLPTPGGLRVGATYERGVATAEVTAGGLARLLWNSCHLLPTLRAVPWAASRSWAGVRPATPDGLPILGPDPAHPGLWWATGHDRSGILLAPITAELLVDAILGRRPVAGAYNVARFR